MFYFQIRLEYNIHKSWVIPVDIIILYLTSGVLPLSQVMSERLETWPHQSRTTKAHIYKRKEEVKKKKWYKHKCFLLPFAVTNGQKAAEIPTCFKLMS